MENPEQKPLIHSEAWPSDQKPEIHSQIHDILRNLGPEITKEQIKYRVLVRNDIPEVRNLHMEWFPVKYGDDYFNIIGKYQHIISIGAFYKPDQNKAQKILVGAIIARIQRDDTASDIINKRGCCYKFTKFFKFWHDPALMLYIMTIGVVDEVRRMGIGSILIEKSIELARERFPLCSGIDLHVIEHNKSAIEFYKKKGYQQLQKIDDYYTLNGKHYSAYHFGKLFDKNEEKNGNLRKNQ